MEDHSEHIIDKSDFPRGEWDNEPDKFNWIDELTNLDCMIVRNRMGALCGYVAVTIEHPCFGKDYMSSYDDEGTPTDNPINGLHVHGGITYGNECAGHICHIPEVGRPDRVWWLGFDCAHSGDFVPQMWTTASTSYREAIMRHDTYRNIEYVKEECRNLALQLKAIQDEAENPGNPAAPVHDSGADANAIQSASAAV